MSGPVIAPGDRVELVGKLALYHGIAHGTVTAVYDGQEDAIEVRLDDDAYTCVDLRHIRKTS